MPTILIVEDEAPNVEILERLLSRKGYETVVAGTKSGAMETASTQQIDLILMDIGIPDNEGEPPNKDGGLEVTRWLKLNSETSAIPVIATSASAMLDEKKRFLDAGCDDVQSKPFDFATLLACIESQLSGSN